MTELLISNAVAFFIGIIGGLVVSFISWHILFVVIVPKIEFSQYISKVPADDNQSHFKYRIKLKNVGIRNILDVEVYARLRIKGLSDKLNDWTVISIPLTLYDVVDKIPRIPKGNGQVVRLYIDEAKELEKPLFKGKIGEAYKSDEDLLEKLLSLGRTDIKDGKSALLRIYVFGYDTVSGTRKAFTSPKPYTIDSIRPGPYKKGSLDIK